MNPLLQQSLPYLFTVLLILGAKIAEVILKGKKNNNIDEDKIRKILEKFCAECPYKQHSVNTELIEKEINLSARILKDLHGKMKSDFMKKCAEFMDKNAILDSNVYALFENTFHSSEEKIIDELRNQFTKNNISKLTTFEISNRAFQLWQIIIDIFDQYYKTAEKPLRIDLYDLYEINSDKYINILERVYSESKEINNKE